jgi:enamine deaminase RidA (YjgF/YER057c/UK114 family)
MRARIRDRHRAVAGDRLRARRAFRDIRPATAMVEVRQLIDPDMLVEIEADAGGRRSAR